MERKQSSKCLRRNGPQSRLTRARIRRCARPLTASLVVAPYRCAIVWLQFNPTSTQKPRIHQDARLFIWGSWLGHQIDAISATNQVIEYSIASFDAFICLLLAQPVLCCASVRGKWRRNDGAPTLATSRKTNVSRRAAAWRP